MRERDDETPLDRALGDALREMVAGEPPAGLRGRVMARLSAAGERAMWARRLAWAAGLAGAVVALVFLVRPERQVRTPRHVVSATPSAPVTMPTQPQEPAATPVAATAVGLRSSGRSGRPTESLSFVDALRTPEPVETAPLRNEELILRRMVISGLEVSRLDIEPLGPS